MVNLIWFIVFDYGLLLERLSFSVDRTNLGILEDLNAVTRVLNHLFA